MLYDRNIYYYFSLFLLLLCTPSDFSQCWPSCFPMRFTVPRQESKLLGQSYPPGYPKRKLQPLPLFLIRLRAHIHCIWMHKRIIYSLNISSIRPYYLLSKWKKLEHSGVRPIRSASLFQTPFNLQICKCHGCVSPVSPFTPVLFDLLIYLFSSVTRQNTQSEHYLDCRFFIISCCLVGRLISLSLVSQTLLRDVCPNCLFPQFSWISKTIQAWILPRRLHIEHRWWCFHIHPLP